jgi:hypothetical protein
MTTYYKYLNLDYEPVAEKIRKFLETRSELITDEQDSWIYAPREIIKEVPELLTLFKPLGLDILMMGFFVMHYKVTPIHIDKTEIPIRINFPILNCENTETRYFKTVGPAVEKTQVNNLGFVEYQPDQCEVVDRFKLTQAVAMRVLEPHQVLVHHDNFPRISCTVAFKQDLSHLLS